MLALGGTMARLHAAGCVLTLVSATDGERAHPTSSAVSPAELAERRAGELVAALDVLEIDVRPRRLGLPDSGLAGVEQELGRLLEPLAAESDLASAPGRGTRTPTTRWWDGRAAGSPGTCRSGGSRSGRGTGRPPGRAAPWDRVRVVDVRDRLEAKLRAVDRFASQVLPVEPSPQDAAVLPPEVLAHFSRPYEAVLV